MYSIFVRTIQNISRRRMVSTSAGTKRTMTRIGTHSGTFHCDEALGCYLLQQTEQFGGAEIVRSRDSAVLDDLDCVIDVGGVYDPSINRFDHHQRGFSEVFGHGFVTKLSSAGLVYKHFGKQLIAKALSLPESHASVQAVYLAVYKNFMEAVDAIDNGVNQYESTSPPKYVQCTDLSARVARLNTDWNQKSTPSLEYEQFMKAVALTGSEFDQSVTYYAKSWLPARDIVVQSLRQRLQIHESGKVISLGTFCPWKEHLYLLEKELDTLEEGAIQYVLYEDDREKKWRIQAVSKAPGSFESRKPLPAAWRGLRDEELSSVAGIPGCVFVHISGFIGGNATYEGALAMADKAIASS